MSGFWEHLVPHPLPNCTIYISQSNVDNRTINIIHHPMSITVQYTSSTPGWKKSYLATHCLRMPMLLEWFFDKDDKVSMMKMIISMIKMIMAQWQGNVLDDGTNQIRFGKWFFIITNTLKISFPREICCRRHFFLFKQFPPFSFGNLSETVLLSKTAEDSSRETNFCSSCFAPAGSLPPLYCTLSSNYLSMLSFIFRF